MKPIIQWIGGKSLFVDKLLSIIPEHEIYCEVFFGGGSLFFSKMPSKIEIINDLNSELTNLYSVLKCKSQEFKEREKYELYSRDIHESYLKDYMSGKHFSMDDIERAFRFFYIINSSFNGIFDAGWSYSITRNQAKSFFDKFKRVDECSLRLKNAAIENKDFEEVINACDSDDTLYYVDPPYFLAPVDDYYFKSYSSKTTFDKYDHQRLYLTLKNIKGKFILSYDDCSWVRDRYGQFNIIDYKVYYSSATRNGNKGKYVNELIITNYDHDKIKKHVDTKQSRLF